MIIITTEELKILAKQGEGHTLEFKESLSKKFAVEVVAFANSIGGKIQFDRMVNKKAKYPEDTLKEAIINRYMPSPIF